MQTALLSTQTPELLARACDEATRLLAAGEPVALPTETVYGLAGDALRPEAAARIFEAKERPFFDPLICHLPARDWLERMAEVPEASRELVAALAERFWPGPLTFVLPRRKIVPDLITAGLETVALRMSAHPVFRAIVERFGKPLAAPSANRFGRISPTTAAHVRSELEGRIPLIVNGGPTLHGIESTIVAVEAGRLRLLRAGPVTPEDLAAVWCAVCERRGASPAEPEIEKFLAVLGASRKALLRGDRDTALEAPGQMLIHYAPRTPLRLLAKGAHLRFSIAEKTRIGLLAFRSPQAGTGFASEEILSPSGDLREAASRLFASLRRLDEAGLDLILAESVPEYGLGLAIMDRLRKAAAGEGNARP